MKEFAYPHKHRTQINLFDISFPILSSFHLNRSLSTQTCAIKTGLISVCTYSTHRKSFTNPLSPSLSLHPLSFHLSPLFDIHSLLLAYRLRLVSFCLTFSLSSFSLLPLYQASLEYPYSELCRQQCKQNQNKTRFGKLHFFSLVRIVRRMIQLNYISWPEQSQKSIFYVHCWIINTYKNKQFLKQRHWSCFDWKIFTFYFPLALVFAFYCTEVVLLSACKQLILFFINFFIIRPIDSVPSLI